MHYLNCTAVQINRTQRGAHPPAPNGKRHLRNETEGPAALCRKGAGMPAPRDVGGDDAGGFSAQSPAKCFLPLQESKYAGK